MSLPFLSSLEQKNLSSRAPASSVTYFRICILIPLLWSTLSNTIHKNRQHNFYILQIDAENVKPFTMKSKDMKFFSEWVMNQNGDTIQMHQIILHTLYCYTYSYAQCCQWSVHWYQSAVSEDQTVTWFSWPVLQLSGIPGWWAVPPRSVWGQALRCSLYGTDSTALRESYRLLSWSSTAHRDYQASPKIIIENMQV